VTFNDLSAIDWPAFSTTEQWVKLLDALLALGPQAANTAQRATLADALDAFADHSSSPDFELILKLDRAARRAAQGLRNDNIDAALTELEGASAELKAVAKQLGAVTATLKKEASVLRLERFRQAVTSLTDTIASLNAVSQSLAGDDDAKVTAALVRAVTSAQQLRSLLETKG
jgi:hypothetical protein